VGTEISEKKCARSRKPASRDKGAWRRFHRGGKVFTEAQFTGYPESEKRFARSMEGWSRRRREHGGKGCLRILGLGGRRIGIKASRPLDVDTSLLSSLSDCLKESCVLVTSFLLLFFFFSYFIFAHLSPLDLLFSLAPQRTLKYSRTCSLAK
jgi:hypothetical protein